MYKIINTLTKEANTVNFQRMCEILGTTLDEDFFSPIFTAHSIDANGVQYMVMEVN